MANIVAKKKVVKESSNSVPKKTRLEKNFGSEKMYAPQIFFGPKKFWTEKILEKYFGSKKSLGLKKMLSPIKWEPKNLGQKSLVKIGSVTAEILLI